MLAEFISSRIGDNIFYVPIVFITLLFSFLRMIVQQRLDKFSEFNPDLSIIGVSSGIMFDFEKKMIVSTNWFQRKPVVYHCSDIAKDVNGGLILEDSCADKGLSSHRIEIFTDILDQPIINVSFWTKKQAAKCNAGLRKLGKEHKSSKITEENKTREKFTLYLETVVTEADRIKRKIGKQKRLEYVDDLVKNFETICSRLGTHGDRLLMADALYYFLGDEKNGHSVTGYSYRTFQKDLTNCINDFEKKSGRKLFIADR